MTSIWMEVSKDDYQLPVAVADTARELAEITGKTENNIMSKYSKYKRHGVFGGIVKVEVDE